jgi:hypothetical protein
LSLDNDVKKVIEVLGPENFTGLILPRSNFFDEREGRAMRQIPIPNGFDLNKGVH